MTTAREQPTTVQAPAIVEAIQAGKHSTVTAARENAGLLFRRFIGQPATIGLTI